MKLMKKYSKLFIGLLLTCFLKQSFSFEIYAFGTSAINCKGVDRNKIFTVRLEEMLRAKGIDVNVINGGVDGDNPIWMIKRLDPVFDQYKNIKLIIFEPGPNRPESATVEYSKLILDKFKKLNLPVIYVTPSSAIQSQESVEEFQKEYSLYVYGNWKDNIPWASGYRQSGDKDSKTGGHLTELGCLRVAELMLPLVEKVIQDKKIN